MSALAYKAKEGKIVIVEDMQIETPKTKDFVNMIGALTSNARRTMLVLPEYNANVYLSGRNLQSNKTVVLSDMNTYDLMNTGTLVFTEGAAKMFTEEAAPAEA
jgi:large subunit ribosomal protein L4